MANYYVLSMDSKKDELTVVYHIAIPGAATNFNSMTYRDAIVEKSVYDTGAAPVSVLPDTFGGVDITLEKAKVTSGELYEIVKTVEMDANLSNANKKAELDADYAAESAGLLTKLQDELTFWGFDSD
jgi:hypothetical protein